MERLANLDHYLQAASVATMWRWCGRVVEANAQMLECLGPPSSVGEGCEIRDAHGVRHAGEVIGFRADRVLVMPLDSTQGFRMGDGVLAMGRPAELRVGQTMLGRVFDGVGQPIDHQGAFLGERSVSFDGKVPAPMEREPICKPLRTGVRAIDGMLTVGRGQRVGIFGGSGVGKSTLIGMMVRNTSADVTVVGLVGERGREVREFLEDALGEEGRAKSVVFVSTSDQSPLLRMRAAQAATATAEFYARQGKHVLLVLDSLTRYAMAAREIGLAAGEPPASKGYTPSVFAHLAKLVERAGNFTYGSITAFYTVLMEGDDQQDPIVDSVRSYVDGHVVLSRELAAEGWYPPVHVLDSLSRLMPAVTSREHRAKAMKVRSVMSTYARSADLIRMGAYSAGSDVELDHAMAAMPILRNFLRQERDEAPSLEQTIAALQTMEV
ncbi:FliI/YscN family ATPase [Granulicella cerasi]|uniref:Flagellum-specific ATP synthase n=1 Tax=Granulicella cerasi TaxID=741063 RepID=A0ABW1Z588_9BACT|nr:FliI/YscN family ATPase [Granulicella cerasi]